MEFSKQVKNLLVAKVNPAQVTATAPSSMPLKVARHGLYNVTPEWRLPKLSIQSISQTTSPDFLIPLCT